MRAKRDRNEPEIVRALEAAGAQVFRIDTPGDLLVRFKRQWFVLEIKRELGPKGGDYSKVTEAQRVDQANLAATGDAIPIVRTPHEGLLAIGAVAP